ncbi:MAG: hypothetical protein AAGC77_00225, partial [Pseudomonadota bacterium]
MIEERSSLLGVDIKQDDFERWGGLALISAIFMVATGATFSSLGVLLPSMIAEFEWSWTQGGAGFTVVGLFTGLGPTPLELGDHRRQQNAERRKRRASRHHENGANER